MTWQALGYAAICIVMTFACAANSRRNDGTVHPGALAITATYVCVVMVLWLQVLDGIGERNMIWLASFGGLLLIATFTGLAPRDDSRAIRSVFWSRAARMRRTYRYMTGAVR